MIVRKNFHEYLLNLLNQREYVLLNILPRDISESKGDLEYQILLKKEDVKLLSEGLQKYTESNNIQVFSTFRNSKALIELTDQTKVTIEFVHKLVHKSLVYLDEEEVLEMMDKMAALETPWTPAITDGKNVAFEYMLPVKFKLPEEEIKKK